MLLLETKLEGKTAYFGVARECVRELRYHVGGNWDYHKGCFDHILCQEGGETIYIRIPFSVIHGELDHADTFIRFDKPFVIKHVVNLGLDSDDSSLLDATGFSQFQAPLDKDGHIENKNRWIHAGEEAIAEVLNCLYASEERKSG